SGEINLSIPPLARKLNVTATPRDKTLEPGGNTVINVEAKDANGNAAKDSELAVWVVDESVLALVNYQLSDPVDFFYSERDSDASDFHSREQLVLSLNRLSTEEREVFIDQFRRGAGGGGAMTMSETVNVTAEYGVNASRQIIDLPINGRQLRSLAL